MKVLFITEEDLKTELSIDNNTSGKYLRQAIAAAQDIELASVLGDTFYRKLQNDIITDNLDDDTTALLDDYIRPFLVYQSASELVVPLTYKMANLGVFRANTDYTQSSTKQEVDYLKDYYSNKANVYKARLQEYIKKKGLVHSACDTNLYSSSDCPVWLGGVRGKFC